MRVAVIGVGSMGKNHARAYKELGVLCAVCDPNPDQSYKIGSLHRVQMYSSVKRLLESCKPDAVSIAVPTEYHYDVAKLCLEAGVHVLCEKPLSDSLENAQKLVDLASQHNVVFAVGYIERFNPAFRALETLVANGEFGEITSVNIKRVGGVGRSAGNVVLDLMTHDFNLLLALFGFYPNKVCTHTRTKNGIVDSAQVLLSFGTASAICESNWISPVKVRQVHVTGTKGSCEVDMLKQTIKQFKSNTVADHHVKDFQEFIMQYGLPDSYTVSVFRKEPLKEELSLFMDAIENHSKDIITGPEALDTLKLTIEAAGV